MEPRKETRDNQKIRDGKRAMIGNKLFNTIIQTSYQKPTKKPECSHQASQWGFMMMASYDGAVRSLQGYIKTVRRVRATTLYRLLGAVIHRTVPRVTEFLFDIQMNSSFKELGEDDQSKAYRAEIASLKGQIETGATTHELMETSPRLCKRHPVLVGKYINKVYMQSRAVTELIK